MERILGYQNLVRIIANAASEISSLPVETVLVIAVPTLEIALAIVALKFIAQCCSFQTDEAAQFGKPGQISDRDSYACNP